MADCVCLPSHVYVCLWRIYVFVCVLVLNFVTSVMYSIFCAVTSKSSLPFQSAFQSVVPSLSPQSCQCKQPTVSLYSTDFSEATFSLKHIVIIEVCDACAAHSVTLQGSLTSV